MSGSLGLRPVINASATLTVLGGSLLPPPAVQAMTEAAAHFVDVPEFARRVGARLAELTGNESALVTSGASAAITLAVAACTAKGAAQAFPTASEVVMFRSQRNDYDYGARLTGATIVAVDSADELRAALSRRPSCVLWFAGMRYADGALPLADVVPLAREYGVPVIVDAAAQIPPVASLWRFTVELGADAVIFSGGKGLRGPQTTGLLLGREWLVDGCRALMSPNPEIGRGMKVGKEELAALLASVEWTLDQDEDALLAGYEEVVAYFVEGLRDIATVRAERVYPSEAGQPHARAVVHLLPSCPLTRAALVELLWTGDPCIAVGQYGDEAIALNPQTLQPGEEVAVLTALRKQLG